MPPEDSQHGVTQVASLGLAVALVVTAVAAGLALGATNVTQAPSNGVSAVQDDGSGPALVRFAHTGADVLGVNVTIDDQRILTDVRFGNVSEYLRVAPGTHTVTVEESRAGGDVLFESDVEFEAGANYTVAGAGEVTVGEEFEPVVLEDNLSAPSENESSVRLAHFSPDAPAVDVTVAETGRVLFENVSYRNASAYANVPAGNHTLEVRPATADNSGPVVTTVDVTLDGGNATTAFAVGYQNPEASGFDRPLQVVVANPVIAEPSPQTMITPTPEGTPVESPTPTGSPTPTESPTNETGG